MISDRKYGKYWSVPAVHLWYLQSESLQITICDRMLNECGKCHSMGNEYLLWNVGVIVADDSSSKPEDVQLRTKRYSMEMLVDSDVTPKSDELPAVNVRCKRYSMEMVLDGDVASQAESEEVST